MTISKIALTVTENDVNTGLQAAIAKMAENNAEMLKKLKDPRIVLKDGILYFKCKTSMSFIPVPIEAQLRLAPAKDGTALQVTLEKVSLAMMGGDAASSALMGQLAGAVAGKPGLAVDGKTLTIDLALLAQLRNITLNGKLNDIEIINGTLALDFS